MFNASIYIEGNYYYNIINYLIKYMYKKNLSKMVVNNLIV